MQQLQKACYQQLSILKDRVRGLALDSPELCVITDYSAVY